MRRQFAKAGAPRTTIASAAGGAVGRPAARGGGEVATPAPSAPTNARVASSVSDDAAMQHLGIGIDTARYGHHVSFLREDKQPAAPPLAITESPAGYDQLQQRLETINGIGQQTAAALIATAVDVQRFETAEHLVGYYGVFPEELQSRVDKFGRPIPAGKKWMCRKANDLVRGLLWQCAKCASAANGGNPAVRALYARRLAKGNSPQVA